MDVILPLVLVGLGSAGLVIGRAGAVVLGGLLVQWAGLVLASTFASTRAPMGVLLAEGATALACAAVLFLTLAGLEVNRPRRGAVRGVEGGGRGAAMQAAAEDLWPVVVLVGAAIAGLVLARLYPLGGAEGLMIAFYWSLLAGVLVMVLEGARDPVKLAAGLFALLNSVALLLNTLTGAAADPVAVGMLSVSRIALAVVLAYGWAAIQSTFQVLNLSPLFSARDPQPQVIGAEAEAEPEEIEVLEPEPVAAPVAYVEPPLTVDDTEGLPVEEVEEVIEIGDEDEEDEIDVEEDEEWLRRIRLDN
jgi:hypothetical protein